MGNTTFRNEKLFCLNCGGEYKIEYPMAIDALTKTMEVFNGVHEDCEKTWEEPAVDQNMNTQSKALWWISNGETGLSSKTMWSCFMDQKDYPINHPYDPDDFKRCYKLLQSIPEWNGEMHKLKDLSTAWSNLVDNWDELESMYERNVRENWENADEIGMYKFMQTLIK